jgi:UDP-2-acetamido-2-deoxy-ribo-hexuluronate aminotransferase
MNSRLDEVQAAILKKMLELRFDSWTSRRKSIASRFKDEIKSEGFDVLPFNAKSESVWHLFPILVRGQRSDVIAKLADAGIQSAPHYPKLISDQDVLKGAFSSDDTPQAKTLAASVLSLPIHPYLTDDEVTQVIMTVNSLR